MELMNNLSRLFHLGYVLCPKTKLNKQSQFSPLFPPFFLPEKAEAECSQKTQQQNGGLKCNMILTSIREMFLNEVFCIQLDNIL